MEAQQECVVGNTKGWSTPRVSLVFIFPSSPSRLERGGGFLRGALEDIFEETDDKDRFVGDVMFWKFFEDPRPEPIGRHSGTPVPPGVAQLIIRAEGYGISG